jgi:membrane AbrB-like protein
MDSFSWFTLTIVVAALGGALGHRLNIPAGIMLGAMLGTSAFNVLTSKAVFYPALVIVIQVLAGAMIASRMNLAVIRAMKKLVVPTIILVACMFALNLVLGSITHSLGAMDAVTAFFSTAPGGSTEMVVMSEALGANLPYVALLQLARLLIIATCMPLALKRGAGQSRECAAASQSSSSPSPAPQRGIHNDQSSFVNLLWLLVFSTAGGMALHALGVTAGALIGSMFGGTIYSVLRGGVPFPQRLKMGVQVASGAFIGFRVQQETIAALGSLGVPLLIVFAGVLLSSFGIGFLIHKLTKLDLLTCIIASTPGGQQEMALLSEDLGADTPSVAVMQTARLVSVILFFPTLLKLYFRLVGFGS